MTRLPLIIAVAGALSFATAVCTAPRHPGMVVAAVHRGVAVAATVSCGVLNPLCTGDDGVHRGLAAASIPTQKLATTCDVTDPLCTGDDGVHRGLPAVHRGVTLAATVSCGILDPLCTSDDGVHRG